MFCFKWQAGCLSRIWKPLCFSTELPVKTKAAIMISYRTETLLTKPKRWIQGKNQMELMEDSIWRILTTIHVDTSIILQLEVFKGLRIQKKVNAYRSLCFLCWTNELSLLNCLRSTWQTRNIVVVMCSSIFIWKYNGYVRLQCLGFSFS